MKTLAIILAVLGLASAAVIPVPVAPLVGHVATQYHAQDELGQYVYGYNGGPSAKEEIKTADGITRGGYTYIDGNGLLQTTQYVSDPVNGFRVAATNLPAGPAVPAGPEAIVVPSASVVPVVSAENPATAVQPVPANPEPSTVLQSSVTQLEVQQPAPVEEKSSEADVVGSDAAGASASSAQGETKSVEVPTLQVATIEQLVTPVQDTPEVQAAKAAHLAAVEQVKLRDAAQQDKDAQENQIAASEEQEEKSEEGVEPTEASDEGTEATPASSASSERAQPSSEVTQAAPVQLVPETPVRPAITPSVVATELTPAQGPLAAPLAAPPATFQLVPSVLTREVVAAGHAGVATAPVITAPALVAAPGIVSAPVVGTPSGPVALEHVGQITSQYHAQDELGQYTYGYSGGPSAKHELKTVDGQTSGGYSYIDSHGLVQTAAYLSDPVNGFRVAATNIPQQRAPEYIPDSPEVEEAKQKLFQAQAEHIAKL